MNFKTTIAMVLIFVLLIGVYFLVLRGKSKTNYQTRETISKAYGIEKNDVTKIRLEYKDKTLEPFTLVRDNGNWRFTKPINAKADGEKVDKLLKNLLDRKVKRRITKVDNLAKYGLKEPQIKYTVWTKNKSCKFLIGNEGVSYSVYAKEAGENSVITIEHTVLEYFSKSPADLRDRSIFNFQTDKVTQIALNYPGRSIVCKRNPKNREWEIAKPIQTKADYDEVNKFLNKLNGLKVDAFEKENEKNFAPYGLTKPRIEVTVSAENSQTTLQIGNKLLNANRVYAKLKGYSSVFSIRADAAAELTKTVYDLRNKQVIDFQRTDVNKFVIERTDEKITCKQNSKGEWWIVEPINVKADKNSIEDFLFALDALKAEKFLGKSKDLKKYGLESPSIKVTLYEIGKIAPVTLLIGAQKNVMLYVKSGLSDKVYLVKDDILEEVDKKSSDFRNKRITSFYSGDAVELALNYDDKSIICKKHGDDWRISKPVNVDADDDKVNNILYILNKIKAKKFVPEHPSLKNPQVSAMVKLNDGTVYTLLVGTDANEDSAYAKVKEIQGAFTIDKSIAKRLKPSVDALRASNK